MAVVAEYQTPYAKVTIVDDGYRDAPPGEIQRRQQVFEQTARRILTDTEIRLREKSAGTG